jgi:hypothetical protein
MTLPLYGKASASAGFEPSKARSVIRVRSIESSVERHPSVVGPTGGADVDFLTPDEESALIEYLAFIRKQNRA